MSSVNEKQPMVSVIVASYNPIYEKLQRTVCSVILQKNIEIQLIVVDDGSDNNCFDELGLYIKSMGYERYTLISSKQNQGTCKNIMQGLQIATGKYVKVLSPGDYLYEETTLCDWCNYLEENNLQVTFGDAVYYAYGNEQFTVLKKKSLPQRKELYERNHYRAKAIMINYICAFDAIVGANFMIKTKLFKKYLEQIIPFVKYGEDMVFRKMLFDNIDIVRYPRNVIYYEYGTGISTAKSKKWNEIISKEIWSTYDFIMKDNVEDSFFKKRIFFLMKKAPLEKTFRRVKYIIFPSLIYWKLKKKIIPIYTSTNVNMQFVKEIHIHE